MDRNEYLKAVFGEPQPKLIERVTPTDAEIHRRVVSIIGQSDYIDRSALLHKCFFVRSTKLNEILATLESEGLLDVVRKRTAGRTATTYKIVAPKVQP